MLKTMQKEEAHFLTHFFLFTNSVKFDKIQSDSVRIFIKNFYCFFALNFAYLFAKAVFCE